MASVKPRKKGLQQEQTREVNPVGCSWSFFDAIAQQPDGATEMPEVAPTPPLASPSVLAQREETFLSIVALAQLRLDLFAALQRQLSEGIFQLGQCRCERGPAFVSMGSFPAEMVPFAVLRFVIACRASPSQLL